MSDAPKWNLPAPRTPSDQDLLAYVIAKADRIAAYIGDTTPAGCWEWQGAKTYNGYGQTSGGRTWTDDGPFGWRERRRTIRAHRAVFMLHHERPIADGMTLHHTCENKACVNPAHLVELPQAENQAASLPGGRAFGGASIRYRPTRAGVDRWAVLFKQDGKQSSKTFGTIEEAEAYADLRRAGAAA